jgi:hypothetical protein
VLLNHVLRDETFSSLPSLRRVVEYVVDRESFRVGSGERIEFGFEEDIRRVDVGVDQRDLGSVERVLHCCSDDLLKGVERKQSGSGMEKECFRKTYEHRSDTSSTSNHSDLGSIIRRVLHLTLGTLYA